MAKLRHACYLVATIVAALGTGAISPVVWADGAPTSCEGIENCEMVSSSEQLTNFFTEGTGGYLTREGVSTMIIDGDFTMGLDYYISGVDLSIYLGNHTITANDYSFLFYNSTVNIYGDGGSINNSEGYYSPLYLREGTVATMNGGELRGGTVNGGEAGVIMDDGAKFTLNYGDIYAETWVISAFNDTEFVMNGGTITTTGPDSIGVAGNGTADSSKPNYGGNAKFILNAGTITSNDVGVYAPQVGGETVLGEGLTINAAKCGVEVRAGELTVDGATISVPADAAYEFTPNGSGTTASGVAIAVSQHTTKQPISATVKGGTFTAPVAFGERNPQHNPEEDVEKVELSIEGGVFSATNGDPIVSSEDVTGFVTGGTYNKNLDENYIADGYKAYAGNNGTVYNVLPLMPAPSGEDYTGGEEEDANTVILTQTAGEILGTLLDNYADLTDDTENPIAFETESGTTFYVTPGDAKAILENGLMVSTEMYSSEFDEGELYDGEREALNKVLAEGMVVYGYVDYSIELGADGELYGNVTKVPEALTLTYDVSGAPAVPEGMTRVWKAIRLHFNPETGEYEATIIDATYDEETQTVAFESDEFSAFVLIYEDSKEGGAAEKTSKEAAAPETGTATVAEISAKNASLITAIMVGISVSILTFVYLRRRNS